MKVLITDAQYPNLDLEYGIFQEAGIEVVAAQCKTAEEVAKAARGCTALLVQYAPVDRKVFETVPELRIVSRAGVGVDSVDLEAAREHGVVVANVPDYGVREVSAHAVGMILSLVRHLPFLDREVRSGTWNYLSTGRMTRPGQLTLGVAGLGRIGRTVALEALSWFGRVLGYDPYLPSGDWPSGIVKVDLDEFWANSNVVSLHLPLTEQTRHLVDGRSLSSMPQGSYLVNTARGGLVDLDALLTALDDGRLAGAALDVLPQEPPPPDHPVLDHPRVLLTPHAAFYSQESEVELRSKGALNIVNWRDEGKAPYTVVGVE